MSTESTPAAPPPSASKTPLWIAIAAVAGLVLGSAVTFTVMSLATASAMASAEAEADTRLLDAVDDCGSADGIELADGDRTLVIDVMGEDDASGADYADQACILEELDMPASVESHINQTTSMDGRQTESWDGVTIEWSYHPDRGSDMVIMLDDE